MLFLPCVPEVPLGEGMLVSVLSQGTSFHTQMLLVPLTFRSVPIRSLVLGVHYRIINIFKRVIPLQCAL